MKAFVDELLGGNSITGVRRTPNPAKDFTQIANAAIRDPRLSAKARGIVAWLLSHKPGFTVTEDGMERAGLGGTSAIRAGMKELITHGYVHRFRSRNADGTYSEPSYLVTDQPDTYDLAHTAQELQKPRSQPTCDFPRVDNPRVENQPPKKTRNKKTNKQNTPGRPEGAEERTGLTSAREREAATPRPDTTTPADEIYLLLPHELRHHPRVRNPLPARAPRPLAELVAQQLEHRTLNQLAQRAERRWNTTYAHAVHSEDGEGIRNAHAVARALLRPTMWCTDHRCEDGTNIDTGNVCDRCEEHRQARRHAARNKIAKPERSATHAEPLPLVCDGCDRPFPTHKQPPDDGLCIPCRTHRQADAAHARHAIGQLAEQLRSA